MSLAGEGGWTLPFPCDLHSVALEGLCLLSCVAVYGCSVLISALFSKGWWSLTCLFALCVSFSLFPPLFSLLCLIFVVLGDTYNIPLDPRGKQTYPQVPVHVASDSGDVC